MADEVGSTGEQSPLVLRYLEMRSTLVRFFTARTGSAAEAEDLVQEVYLKIVGVNANDVANPAGFLYQLGANLWLDRYRSRERAKRRERAYWTTQGHSADAEPVTADPSPEEVTNSRQRLRQLIAAVRQLPPQCRRVFELHKLDGLSHSQVAEKLGISRSTVEKHMIAALKHLSAKFDD